MQHCPTCGRVFDTLSQPAPPCAPIQRQPIHLAESGIAGPHACMTIAERDRIERRGARKRGMDRLLTDMGGDDALPLASIGPGGINHPDSRNIHE